MYRAETPEEAIIGALDWYCGHAVVNGLCIWCGQTVTVKPLDEKVAEYMRFKELNENGKENPKGENTLTDARA